MTQVLLLVAVRTDQPDIKRRIEMILAGAQSVAPLQPPAQVRAADVDELTANDLHRLAAVFGERAVRDLALNETPATSARGDNDYLGPGNPKGTQYPPVRGGGDG